MGMSVMRVISEPRLVAATGRGPSDAPLASTPAIPFETVFETHHRDVARYVYLVTRGQDDAEEIVAETFARAFAAWREGRGPAGRPLPWLLVIARHLATDRARHRRLISWLPLDLPGDSSSHQRTEPGGIDADASAAEFWLWLAALSKALPARQREVIFLRYQRDLTDAEIGEILHLSASGVRTLASRAIQALRRHPELWS